MGTLGLLKDPRVTHAIALYRDRRALERLVATHAKAFESHTHLEKLNGPQTQRSRQYQSTWRACWGRLVLDGLIC